MSFLSLQSGPVKCEIQPEGLSGDSSDFYPPSVYHQAPEHQAEIATVVLTLRPASERHCQPVTDLEVVM